MTFTRHQASALGRGLTATVERSKEQHSLTLQFDWTGSVPENRLLAIIDRTVEANFETHVQITRKWHSELNETRDALERSEAQVEQLRTRVRELEAQRDMQPPAATRQETGISLKAWAASRGWSYSTAWRHKEAGRVQYTNVGGGRKHDNVLVFPETFVAPVKGKKS